MAGGTEFNREKFEELIVYIARRLGPEAALGRVKLAKLLMHSDFTAYARLGHSITGARYEKWQHGHLASEQTEIEKDLEAAGVIGIGEEDYYGKKLRRITAHRDPDLSSFTEDELAIVEGALRLYGHESASYLSQLAHSEPGWVLAKMREEIPYFAGLIGRDRPPDHVFDDFRKLHGLTA